MNSRHNRSSNRMRKKRNVKDGIKTGNYYRDSGDWRKMQIIQLDRILKSIRLK